MEKILIVEDEQGIRDTLKEILEFAGYEVLIAANGKIGFDLIIGGSSRFGALRCKYARDGRL